MRSRFLKGLLLAVLIVASVILGRMIGEAVPDIAILSWLAEGVQFGFDPTKINLCILNITVGFQVSVNIAQIILIILSIFIYACWIARDYSD